MVELLKKLRWIRQPKVMIEGGEVKKELVKKDLKGIGLSQRLLETLLH
jgi:hypothetical protein